MHLRHIAALGMGLVALVVSACQIGVVDKPAHPRTPAAVPPSFPDIIRGGGPSPGTGKPSTTPKPSRSTSTAASAQKQQPPADDKPAKTPKPTGSPTSGTDRSGYGGFLHLTGDQSLTVDCAGRDVIIEQNRVNVVLRGECPDVTVHGSGNNLVIETVGEVAAHGDNNDVYCRDGMDGASTSSYAYGDGNTFINCGMTD